MDIRDTIFAALFAVIAGLLIPVPPLAVWRSGSRRASRGASWPCLLLASFGPSVVAVILIVLVWLPAYTGQCGGWLGETTPCSGFAQYAAETMFWAAMTIAVPGLLGVLLGIAVMVLGSISRRMFRNTR